MDYQAFRTKAVEFMLNRGWKKLTAKRRDFQQSLFDHTLIEIDSLITLLPLLHHTFSPPLTETEEQVLLTSVLAHDVGKELAEWQEYVMGKRDFLSDVNQELAEEVVSELANHFGFSGANEMLSSVLLHMGYERTPAKVMNRLLYGGHDNQRWKTLADIVDAVDNLCSAPGIFAGLQYIRVRACISNHLHASYHLVQMRGVSTTLLHRASVDAFEECGWRPLIHYSNGTIYVASSVSQPQEPSIEKIQAHMAAAIENAMPNQMAKLVVGSPLANMMPKPELFDYRDLRDCLTIAARRVNRTTFRRKSESQRRKTIVDYLERKNDDSTIDEIKLALETDRIGVAQPEMCIFKFFKAALAPSVLGNQVTSEAQETYSNFAKDNQEREEQHSEQLYLGIDGSTNSSKKKKLPKITPQTVAQMQYDSVFGDGAYAALQSTSTLMPAREMAATIDRFWILDGSRFERDMSRIEYLDDTERQQILIDTLVDIANDVYSAIPTENRPIRATSEDIAQCFMPDLIYPSPNLQLDEIIAQQLQAYGQTKANARKEKGLHLCPICNSLFDGGTKAKADFVANPKAHTNRGVSHGSGGQIVICDSCKFERFLQQLLLGSQVTDMLVLFPRMNIGHSSGEALRKKAIQIQEKASIRMTGDDPEPDQHITLSLINLIARNLSNNNVYQLTPNEIVEMLTYKSTEDTKKKHRKTLDKELKEFFSTDELDVEDLNEEWATNFHTTEDAVRALIEGAIQDDDARQIRAKAFNLVPQLRITCQTPHMIFVPTTNPLYPGKSVFQKQVGKSWESEVNTGIRELYLNLILGLSLDCSVAVVKVGEVITFDGGEGVAKVPSAPALRDLIGADWVSIDAAEKWLQAIGAAALLANSTEYPESSNLYEILKSPTPGHVLRRIEQKSGGGQANMDHFHLLEKLKEVLR